MNMFYWIYGQEGREVNLVIKCLFCHVSLGNISVPPSPLPHVSVSFSTNMGKSHQWTQESVHRNRAIVAAGSRDQGRLSGWPALRGLQTRTVDALQSPISLTSVGSQGGFGSIL